MEENKNCPNAKTEGSKGLLAKLKFKRVIIHFAFTVIGIVAGYTYYSLVGCNRGCTITSSPYLSILWGGMIGFLLPGVFEKPKSQV